MKKEKNVNTENIHKFVKDTCFTLMIGECRFGRPCVGIMNMETECWIGYHDLDAAYNFKPEDAYHKDDYLCVLYQDDKEIHKAINQLEIWLKGIVESGYKIISKENRNGIASFIAAGPVTQKALSNP
jgi:hypothetical protein